MPHRVPIQEMKSVRRPVVGKNPTPLEIESRRRALEIFRVEKYPARGGISISKLHKMRKSD